MDISNLEEVLDVNIGPVITALLTVAGMVILDTITMQVINRRKIPVHYAKHLTYNEPMRSKAAEIVQIVDSDKIVVLWGRNMVQIWNFGRDTACKLIEKAFIFVIEAL